MNQFKSYYSEKLSGEKLKQCYEIAPPGVKQYLDAEAAFVAEKIHPGDLVLELGCGYGRVIPLFAEKACLVIGVDISFNSLLLGKKFLHNISNSSLIQMNAAQLSFPERAFDIVVCIQNGISALNIDRKNLISESIHVTKPGGTILFSSYSEKFWKHRLEWFRLQSEAGFLGEIDYEKTKDGVIVCKDGFTASTAGEDHFLKLASGFAVNTNIIEVDKSSLFCEMIRI